MAKKEKLSGTLYQRNERWWWRVKLPGQENYKAIPLKAFGQQQAYRGKKEVAFEIAQRLWCEAVFKSGQDTTEFDGTIAGLAKQYLAYANETYRKVDGSLTRYVAELQLLVKVIIKYCGNLSIEEFGPKKLKDFRSYLAGLKRTIKDEKVNRYCLHTLNQRIKTIKTMFKWATSEELVHGNVYYALQSVKSLKAGQLNLEENPEVEPVAIEHVYATLPYTTEVIADMIQIQLLTGMRSIELTGIKPCNIEMDKDKDIWWYRVPQIYNKNARHGKKHERVVPIGPKAQQILQKYLLRNNDSFCFSPKESEKQRREKLTLKRKTPLSCGNTVGSNRKSAPKTMPSDKYDSQSYGKAIASAIRTAQNAKVEVPHWSPHQLRHSAATLLANEFDLDTASTVLGHKSLEVTRIYVKKDIDKIVEKYKKIG